MNAFDLNLPVVFDAAMGTVTGRCMQRHRTFESIEVIRSSRG